METTKQKEHFQMLAARPAPPLFLQIFKDPFS
jgi:hypothetical protein